PTPTAEPRVPVHRRQSRHRRQSPGRPRRRRPLGEGRSTPPLPCMRRPARRLRRIRAAAVTARPCYRRLMSTYPAPPWRTHGHAVFRAYRVPTSAIELPEGLVAQSTAGYSLGLLGFVRYVAPSPLEYAELIWMPTRVSAARRRGDRKSVV